MHGIRFKTTLSGLLGGAALSVLAATMVFAPVAADLGGGAAYAQGHGSPQGGQGFRGGAGGSGGAGGDRATTPQAAQPTSPGQRGPSPDSDARGPRYGGGDQGQRPPPGTRGGRPVWAQEGIPEVELGRLSVVRAPSHVIERALAEVLTNWSTIGSTVLTLTAPGQPTLTMTVAQLYSLPADQFANIVKTDYDSITRIDSPLENLALFQDIRVDGTTQLTGVTPASAIDLAAILLGSASDKTLPITTDTVLAVNIILQLPTLSATDLAALAAGAEAVRAAILEGHE